MSMQDMKGKQENCYDVRQITSLDTVKKKYLTLTSHICYKLCGL